MDKDAYIKRLEAKIADLEQRMVLLEKRNQELERRLGINSQNSSKPPSSDGPEVPKPQKRGNVRRKRGAKKGHQPHIRKMYPPEEVTKFVPHEPHAGILKHKEYLWTFVADQKMAPTNNYTEQIVRQGVPWRKSSFGAQSARGARYVERILTACATCRLQNRSIIEYLRKACHCYLNGTLVPNLVVNS